MFGRVGKSVKDDAKDAGVEALVFATLPLLVLLSLVLVDTAKKCKNRQQSLNGDPGPISNILFRSQQPAEGTPLIGDSTTVPQVEYGSQDNTSILVT